VIVVAENINVMRATVGGALKALEKGPIQDLARRSLAAGADVLDVNVGPARKDGENLMTFVIEAVAEVVSCQLCLDTTNAAAMEAGIVRCQELGLPRPIVNSFSLQQDKLEQILPLAARYGCEIIGMTMRGSIPITAADRLNLAFELVAAANEAGISNDRIFIDPVVLPLGVDMGQRHAVAVQEVVAALPEMFDPPVRSLCGLTNISSGAPNHLRPAINNAYMAMLAALGVGAVIVDVLDPECMRTVRLVRALSDQSLYSVSDAEFH
jgi:5-methyltetrahydrofolate corrinoid/iron sulfur protein methyltransferase